MKRINYDKLFVLSIRDCQKEQLFKESRAHYKVKVWEYEK